MLVMITRLMLIDQTTDKMSTRQLNVLRFESFVTSFRGSFSKLARTVRPKIVTELFTSDPELVNGFAPDE